MQTILTLKTSSMYFVGDVNLYKDTPLSVDADNLTDKEIQLLNNSIKANVIDSSTGLLTKTISQQITEEALDKEKKSEEVIEDGDKDLEKETKEVKNTPTPKKTTRKTSNTKK